MNTIIECPKCRCQIELRASFASGPRSSSPQADSSEVGELLDRVNIADLSGAELDFVEKTKGRYEQYKDKIRMSEPQMKWLRDIAERGF